MVATFHVLVVARSMAYMGVQCQEWANRHEPPYNSNVNQDVGVQTEDSEGQSLSI